MRIRALLAVFGVLALVAVAVPSAVAGASGAGGFVEKTVEEVGETDAPFCDDNGDEIRYPVVPGETVLQNDRSFTDTLGRLHVNTITKFDNVEYFLEGASPETQYFSGTVILHAILEGETVVSGHFILTGRSGFVASINPDGSLELIHVRGDEGC